MKLGIMQPYFFPYIGYWQLMNAVDLYVVYDDVNYIKGGWINRNRILVNNSASFFNLPLIEASPNKLINEIKINQDRVLLKKNLNKLNLSYKKAPYYNEIYPIIYEILTSDKEELPSFILDSFKKIANYLDIKTDFILSSDIEKNNCLKGQSKVIEICNKLDAAEYYNAIGGTELYNKDVFNRNGIKLSFLETKHIEYKQFNSDFVPNLSIIDVMMFNSKEEIKNMLEMYNLV